MTDETARRMPTILFSGLSCLINEDAESQVMYAARARKQKPTMRTVLRSILSELRAGEL
jgi:hypothetical protein